eukprot:402631_1
MKQSSKLSVLFVHTIRSLRSPKQILCHCTDTTEKAMSNWMILVLLHSLFILIVSGAIYKADVVVYESTPSGIMAAVASSNQTGLHVILLSTTNHIGGLCSGGLGRTDIGHNPDCIGGLARDFFTRNGAIYNESIEWFLEPHVALNIFMKMMKESNVTIITDSPIATSAIDPSLHTIASITTVNKNEYIAKIYIDASYEGDLFATSGVTLTVGRESNQQYNETFNGRTIPKSANNFKVYVNPYDGNGNLLPLIQPYDNAKPGEGDKRLSSMNYRLCVTKDASNRVPFTKPSSYDPSRWELLRRMYTIVPPQPHVVPSANTRAVPNGKYDMNNGGPISTDFIGFSNDYINATYQRRQCVAEQTRNYTLELLWFLCSDDSVPSDARDAMNNEWGLCQDEFVENNYFPPQLYVREGRRMINKEFVFTQHVAQQNAEYHFNERNVSIGMGSFNFDAHNVQRFACVNASMCWSRPEQNASNGCADVNDCAYAWNEGDVEINPGITYQIPYMVLTATPGEANNLLVSVGVSASHIGYSTLRMEPQFMIMGHAAGTAASILIKHGNPNSVHSIDFNLLKRTLLDQGQYLSVNR